MSIRISTVAAVALLVIAPLTVSRAQATGTVCNDGTTSTAVGKGACSGHGGVRTATKASATAKAKTATTKPAIKTTKATKAAKSSTKMESGETKMAKPAKSVSKAAPKAETKKTTAKTKTAAKPAAQAASAGDKDPKGATALCKDGTYSHAATHQGACSGHGGVDKFLR